MFIQLDINIQNHLDVFVLFFRTTSWGKKNMTHCSDGSSNGCGNHCRQDCLVSLVMSCAMVLTGQSGYLFFS